MASNRYAPRGFPGKTKKLVVYDLGDEKSSVTGGWQISTTSSGTTFVKNATNLQASGNTVNGNTGAWITMSMVDFSPYTRLIVQLNNTDTPEGCIIGGASNRTGSPYTDGVAFRSFTISNGVSALSLGTYFYEANIANAFKTYYPSFQVTGANYGNTSGTVQLLKMWLE